MRQQLLPPLLPRLLAKVRLLGVVERIQECARRWSPFGELFFVVVLIGWARHSDVRRNRRHCLHY